MGLITIALNQLNDDFSNIDKTYKDLKSNWSKSNAGKTELEFIGEFNFSNGYDVDSIDKNKFTSEELENLQKLSGYLGKKISKVEWTNKDYLNRYIKTKSFGFLFFKTYKGEDFNSVVKALQEYKIRYDFIFENLSEIERVEFKNDFCDQLCLVRDKQTSKYREVFNTLIDLIGKEYLGNKTGNNIFQETQKTFEEINRLNKDVLPKSKKIPEKWQALLYWIELKARDEKPPLDREGAFIRSELEKIGSYRTGTTGQSFYRHFKEIKEHLLDKAFGNDWKDRIIKLSNNDEKIINYLQTKYPS